MEAFSNPTPGPFDQGIPPDAGLGPDLESEPQDPASVAPPGVGTGEPGRGLEKRSDLLTVFTLGSWLEDGLRRIGRKRLRAIIEVYATTGGLSQPLQEALLQIISIDGTTDGPKAKVSVKECLHLLAELDSLL